MLEYIIQISIHKRWLVLLAVCALAMLGVFNYQHLSIDAVPDITNVQVQINTEAPGYSPLETEQQITFPLETSLAGIPRLEYTRSLSRSGLSQITAVFRDGTDIYFARQLINERLQEVQSQLPSHISPRMGPIATGLGEIFMYTVESEAGARNEKGETLSSMDLRTVNDWIIRPQLRTVPGVVDVSTIGGHEKQYHILFHPKKLRAYGLSINEILEAIRKNNANIGAGYIEHHGEQQLIRIPAQVQRVEDIERVAIRSSHGLPISIGDVAEVSLGGELRYGAAIKNGGEVVLGTVLMLTGENSRAVAMRVAERMKDIQPTLPKGVKVHTVYDRTQLVNATISTVQKNLFEGAILVIAVLFIMLGNIRAALITACVIPLSMLMTISGMVSTRMSGNLMSLGALDFGIIVDGAVIIVENCTRHLAKAQAALGRLLTLQERLQLVFHSTKEVRRATLFGECIIMVVYLPILTLTGVEGKMFFPMAFTVLLALVSAMILSVTFVPAAVAIFLHGPVRDKETRVVHFAKSFYEKLLRWALGKRAVVLGVAAGIFLFSLFLFSRLGSEFIPSLDEGDLAVHALRPPGTSLTQSIHMQKAVEQAFQEFPEVRETFSKIGTADLATDPMPPSVADGFVLLKPRSQWPNPGKSKEKLIAEMEKKLQAVPGQQYEFLQPIQMRFNELIAGVRSEVAVKIFGDDVDVLHKEGEKVEEILRSIPGAQGVSLEQTTGLPVIRFELHKQKLARLGLSAQDVQDALRIALAGERAGFVFEGDRRFPIVLRLPEAMRGNFSDIAHIPIPLREQESAREMQYENRMYKENGAHKKQDFIPLGELIRRELAPGPNQISRENGKRRIVITANVKGRDIGSFVKDAQDRIRNDLSLPSGYWISWGGQFEQLIRASKTLLYVVPLALALIMLLLYLSLQNILHASLVFSAVPFALSGGICALWLRGIPFSIAAAVGFIALSGVAVLNGLVLISLINQLREQGQDPASAILNGCLQRLRPILMTALVAALGFVPMALATGPGAEVQRPLATVVIGGILSSTALSLLVLPVLYAIFACGRRQNISS